MTDPLNKETTFTDDGAGQLLTATDPLSQTTTFGYEVADVVAVTDPLVWRRCGSSMPPGGCCRCAIRSAARRDTKGAKGTKDMRVATGP